MKTLYKYVYILLCMPLFWISCSDDDDKNVEPDVPTESKLEIIKNVEVFTAEGGTQDVEFSASQKWTVESEQSWCSVSPTTGMSGKRSVAISVKANETTDERNSKVTFKSGTAEKIISVVQKQKNALLLSSAKADVPSEGKDLSVEVKANVNFEYVIDEAAKEWIVPIESRGMKTSTVSFKIKKNEVVEKREGKIYFVAGNLKETFTVYQKGDEARLILNKKEYIIDYNAQDVTIDVESNISDYEIKMPRETWLSRNTSRSMSSYSHVIAVKENTTGGDRSATIKFICGERTDSVKIIQKQKDVIALLLNDSCLNVKAKGGSLCFDVTSNVDFDVKISSSWIAQSQRSRNIVKKSLCFQVENNPSLEERRATLTLEGGEAKQVITVIQEGQTEKEGIEVLNTLSTFGQSAEKQILKIKALGKWHVDVDQPWCGVTPSEGVSGEHDLKVTVEENTSFDERSAQIKFVCGNITELVKIIQLPQIALVVAKDSVLVEAVGGNLDINFESNTDYEISTSVEWIKKATKSRALTAKTVSFIVDENNASIERTGEIIFKKGLDEQKVIVTQKGKKITGRFVMKHSRIQCNVPRFTDSATVTGTINWGDSSTSEYVEGITHTYITPGTYEVVIQLDKVRKVELKDIDGIELIDLSSF